MGPLVVYVDIDLAYILSELFVLDVFGGDKLNMTCYR